MVRGMPVDRAAHGPCVRLRRRYQRQCRYKLYRFADARTTLHARAAWHITPQVRVALSVENAGNKQYFDFYKRAGATAFVEVAVKF